ncbi:hypothetical protein D9Q98_001844 [Chlorella vulgaris]|uniref:U-box domain-containing protein n=1 Tax=Chlorella vulgaris TaxID=3077 RepID=A0A9D4TVJ2_CHLVU|nr:hypothetical protein D9Q98_001844 [Chlorella vulgaris]
MSLALSPRGSFGLVSVVRGSKGSEDGDRLFDAPAELVCPLTLAPFIDPVLTTAGHVYERAAIQAHLERSCTDPLTRQPLLNKSLTPVYVLRSRALEYRESAARACIDRVCSGTPEPLPAARYLRRAVELVADTGSNVQGLSKETIDYFQAHPSNAFDRIGLQLFAQGLYASGYRDRAAAIWSSLLLDADSDRSQQADLLRRCLSCYLDEPSMIGSGGDDYVFEKMVALFEGRVGRDRLVELTQEANLGDAFVLRLCEQLLFRPLPLVGSEEEAPASAATQEKRLLLKYCHVLTDNLQRRQGEVERRLQELDRWSKRNQSSARKSSTSDNGAQSGGRRRLHLPGWARHPALVAVCMLLSAGVPPGHPAARVVRAVPLLALLAPS